MCLRATLYRPLVCTRIRGHGLITCQHVTIKICSNWKRNTHTHIYIPMYNIYYYRSENRESGLSVALYLPSLYRVYSDRAPISQRRHIRWLFGAICPKCFRLHIHLHVYVSTHTCGRARARVKSSEMTSSLSL